MRRREAVTGLLFISPWIIGVCWFFFRNMAQALRFSFSSLTILEEGGFTLTYVGWRNYVVALFENTEFNRELANAVFGMLLNVPLIIFFSLFMAMLLNRKFALRGITRVIFFLPVIMATTAITSSLEQVMLMMVGGVSSISPEMAKSQTGFDAMSVAYLLLDFGMPLPIISYIISAIGQLYQIIRASGVQILIFLAALQSIPGSLYEVAQIEGATAYETFWKITFPMVSPLILTNVVYTIVDTFAQSLVLNIAYNTAFTNNNFGLSSAMSIVSSLVACLVLLLVSLGVSRYVYYQT